MESFKEEIINLIFHYEIFEEKQFNKFVDLVCQKNSSYDQEVMERLFTEIKQFLYS